jgi:hypothetical protein
MLFDIDEQTVYENLVLEDMIAGRVPFPQKRGPKGGPRLHPIHPERVHKIVRLRDIHGLSFKEIAAAMQEESYDVTAQNVHGLYRKWRTWAYSQKI